MKLGTWVVTCKTFITFLLLCCVQTITWAQDMAACNFSIPFSGDPQQVMNKARSAVQGQGGNFDGDINGGNFNVSVLAIPLPVLIP